MGDSQSATSYEVIGKLADGTVAELFLARASSTGGVGGTSERLVAVKRIPRKAAQNVELVKSFLEAGQLAARLSHANIAHVTDVGTLGGSYFVATEYINGETLHALVEHARSKKLQVPVRIVVTIAAAAAAGLQHAHQHNVVHGRVSATNVLVSRDGIVKLVDVGMAKAHDRSSTPVPADDLVALGRLLWELTTLEELRPITESEPAPAPSTRRYDVPPELDAVLARLLASSPAERYQTADDVLAALESLASKLAFHIAPSELAGAMRLWFGHVPDPVVAPSDKPLIVTSEPVPSNLAVAPAANPALDDLLDHVRNASEILRAAAAAAAATAAATRGDRTTVVPGIGDTVEETRENFEQIRDRILAQARKKKETRPPVAGDAVPAATADSPSAAAAVAAITGATTADGRQKRETLNPSYNAYSFITDVAGKAQEPIRKITTPPPASHQVGPRTASFQAVSDQIVADAIAAHAAVMAGDLAASNAATNGKSQESMSSSEEVKSEREPSGGTTLPRTESIDLQTKAESSNPDIAVSRTSSKNDIAASSKNDIAVSRTSSKEDVAVSRTSSKDKVAVSRTSSKDKVAVARTSSKDKVAVSRTSSKDKVAVARTSSKDMKRAKSSSKGGISKAASMIGLTPVDELDENTWPPLPDEEGAAGSHDFRDLDDGQPVADEPHNKRPAWAIPVALAAGAVLVLAILFAVKGGNKPTRRRAAVAALGSGDVNSVGGSDVAGTMPGRDVAAGSAANVAGSDMGAATAANAAGTGSDMGAANAAGTGSDMAAGSAAALGSDMAAGSAASSGSAGSAAGNTVATAAVDPAAEKAKAEADKLAAEEKAKQEKLAAAEQAKAAAEQAKADKLAAEEKAKQEKLAAAEQAKVAAEQAKADKLAAAEKAKQEKLAAAAQAKAAAEQVKADKAAAAEKAKQEKLAAAAQAKAAAEQAKADKAAAAEKAKQEKLAVAAQAKAAAEQAKADKAAAAEKAKQDKLAAAEKAKQDKLAAAEKAKADKAKTPTTDKAKTTTSDKTETAKAPKEAEKSIEDLVNGGEFAKANAACKTNTIFNSVRLTACTIAACNVKDQPLAQRWIRAISKAARGDLIKSCAAMGVTLEDPSAPSPAPAAPAPAPAAPAP